MCRFRDRCRAVGKPLLLLMTAELQKPALREKKENHKTIRGNASDYDEHITHFQISYYNIVLDIYLSVPVASPVNNFSPAKTHIATLPILLSCKLES